MNEFILGLSVVCACANVVLLMVLLSRIRGSQGLAVEVRNELRAGREEGRMAARELRQEVSGTIRGVDESIRRMLTESFGMNQTHFEAMTRQITELTDSNSTAAEGIRTTLDARIKDLQAGNETRLDAVRNEIGEGLKTSGESVARTLDQQTGVQRDSLGKLATEFKELSESNQATLERMRSTVDDRIKNLQEGSDRRFEEFRREVSATLQQSTETQARGLGEASGRQVEQLEHMTTQLKEMGEDNRRSLETFRSAFDERVRELQASNEKKLDEMRQTVDEKLHDTLEKRLGESFKLVGDWLESVHKGLGEMQGLASGVGDLKRVLTNVKTRGTWAEVQLASILEQILVPQQWAKNVCVREGSAERVECAIRLPGPQENRSKCLWLPIDSKFPQEDYLRLQDAAECGDRVRVEAAVEALAKTLRAAAKEVCDRYVNPPETTDFAIMFLATEGLYAEALRYPGLVEELQSKYRVVIAGPMTLAALVNSLRVGFQTLAIEQRTMEVWRVLGAVKTEFGKFGELLDRVRRHLGHASKAIDDTGVRTRALERRLGSVEQLEPAEAVKVLALPALTDVGDEEELPEDQVEHINGAGHSGPVGVASA
jgi:DNA recombination protein RmuC